MKILRSGENLPFFTGTSIAIGKFDGVHLGHQLLLERTRELAFRDSLKSVVITFDPHPLAILDPAKTPKSIIPFEKKCELIAESGVDMLYVINFDKSFSKMSAKDFIKKTLVKTFKAKHVMVGENFRFGKKAQGDVGLLQKFGTKYDFETHAQPLVMDETGQPISSHRVREAITKGDMEAAEMLLGYTPA